MKERFSTGAKSLNLLMAILALLSFMACSSPMDAPDDDTVKGASRFVTVSDMFNYNGRQLVRVGLYPTNNLDSTPSIGALSGRIVNNTLSTGLYSFAGGFNENVPWNGSGEYYVVVRIPPGANQSARGIVDSTVEHIYITTIKFSFSEANPVRTINFYPDFEIVPPREITITGVSGHSGQTVYVTLYPDDSITQDTEVSFTEGTEFFGASFKIELKMKTSHGNGPWYGSGSFYVKLEFKEGASTTATYISDSAATFNNSGFNASVALSAFTKLE